MFEEKQQNRIAFTPDSKAIIFSKIGYQEKESFGYRQEISTGEKVALHHDNSFTVLLSPSGELIIYQAYCETFFYMGSRYLYIKDDVDEIEFCKNRNLVVMYNSDRYRNGSVRLIDFDLSPPEISVVQEYKESFTINKTCFSQDERYLALYHEQGKTPVFCYDLSKSPPKQIIKHVQMSEYNTMNHVEFSPDSKHLILKCTFEECGHKAFWYSLAKKAERKDLLAFSKVHFSPSGNYVVFLSKELLNHKRAVVCDTGCQNKILGLESINDICFVNNELLVVVNDCIETPSLKWIDVKSKKTVKSVCLEQNGSMVFLLNKTLVCFHSGPNTSLVFSSQMNSIACIDFKYDFIKVSQCNRWLLVVGKKGSQTELYDLVRHVKKSIMLPLVKYAVFSEDEKSVVLANDCVCYRYDIDASCMHKLFESDSPIEGAEFIKGVDKTYLLSKVKNGIHFCLADEKPVQQNVFKEPELEKSSFMISRLKYESEDKALVAYGSLNNKKHIRKYFIKKVGVYLARPIRLLCNQDDLDVYDLGNKIRFVSNAGVYETRNKALLKARLYKVFIMSDSDYCLLVGGDRRTYSYQLSQDEVINVWNDSRDIHQSGDRRQALVREERGGDRAIWLNETLQIKKEFNNKSGSYLFSPSSKLLAVTYRENDLLHIYDVNKVDILFERNVKSYEVCFSPDENQLLICCSDGDYMGLGRSYIDIGLMWFPDLSNDLDKALEYKYDEIYSENIHFSPDSRHVVFVSYESKAYWHATDTQQQIMSVDYITHAKFSSDSSYLMMYSERKGLFYIYQTKDGKLVYSCCNERSLIEACFSRDNKGFVYYGGLDQQATPQSAHYICFKQQVKVNFSGLLNISEVLFSHKSDGFFLRSEGFKKAYYIPSLNDEALHTFSDVRKINIVKISGREFFLVFAEELFLVDTESQNVYQIKQFCKSVEVFSYTNCNVYLAAATNSTALLIYDITNLETPLLLHAPQTRSLSIRDSKGLNVNPRSEFSFFKNERSSINSVGNRMARDSSAPLL